MERHNIKDLPKLQKKRHKFNADGSWMDAVTGFGFNSKREMLYHGQCAIRIKAGELSMVLREVPIRLPGKTKYVCDFVEFLPGWEKYVRFVDTKGVRTAMYKTKKRQVEHLYPIEIIEE